MDADLTPWTRGATSDRIDRLEAAAILAAADTLEAYLDGLERPAPPRGHRQRQHVRLRHFAITEACEIAGLTPEQLMSESRVSGLVAKRRIAWRYLHERYHWSYSAIARVCRRDHTTVRYGISHLRAARQQEAG